LTFPTSTAAIAKVGWFEFVAVSAVGFQIKVPTVGATLSVPTLSGAVKAMLPATSVTDTRNWLKLDHASGTGRDAFPDDRGSTGKPMSWKTTHGADRIGFATCNCAVARPAPG
jgi:hypothetical protein